MKYVVLVGDGMGDYPVEALGDQSPLQAANCPMIRKFAALGETRMVQTVPEGLPPGSDVANLALLGYDAALNYTGRAPIEAAGAEIPMSPSDVTFRCNLVTVSEDGLMKDYSAGHITTEEGQALVRSLTLDCLLFTGVESVDFTSHCFKDLTFSVTERHETCLDKCLVSSTHSTLMLTEHNLNGLKSKFTDKQKLSQNDQPRKLVYAKRSST